MSKKIHNILLERSLEQHRSLNSIFTKNGVIFLKKSKKNLFEFMVNLIISQQLSTKAANSIWNNVKDLENSKMLSLMEIFSKKNSDVLKNLAKELNTQLVFVDIVGHDTKDFYEFFQSISGRFSTCLQ